MTIYPLDASGLLTSNLIAGEVKNIYEHQATPGGGYYYYIIPDGAPFFADTLNFKALNGSIQVDLIEGLDYYLGLPFVLGMYLIGRPLYGAIVFRSSIDNLKLVMSYQTLGGAWITTPEKIINPDLPTSASNFGGLSTSFDGPATGTVIGDPLVYGGDPQTIYTDLFAKITNNNYNPKTTSWDVLLDVLPDFPKNCYGQYNTGTADQNDLIAELQKFQDNFTNAPSQAKYITHLVDYNNPHATNKAKLGLDLLENLPWATDTEVVAQATVRKLVTLRQALMLKGVVDPSQLSTATDAVKGPSTVYINTTTPYLINNFDFRETYTIEAVNGGSVSLVGEYINYKAPNTPGVYGFKINGALFPIGAVVGGINLSFEKAPNVTADDIATHVYTDTTVTIDITNYDVGVTYDCSVSDGHVTQSGSKIFVTAPSSPGDIILTVNQEPFTITVVQSFVNPPTILSPDATSQISAGSNFTVSASPFSSTGYQDTQYSAYWEIATDDQFGNIVAFSLNDVINLKIWSIKLTTPGTYYARLKYQGNNLGKSNWSPTISFNVQSAIQYPTQFGQILTPIDLNNTDISNGYTGFGSFALSDDGKVMAIMATNKVVDETNNIRGDVYIYRQVDGVWTSDVQIKNTSTQYTDLYPTGIAISGDGNRIFFYQGEMTYTSENDHCILSCYDIYPGGYNLVSISQPVVALGYENSYIQLKPNYDGSRFILGISCDPNTGIDNINAVTEYTWDSSTNAFIVAQPFTLPTLDADTLGLVNFGYSIAINAAFDRCFIFGCENKPATTVPSIQPYVYFYTVVDGVWTYKAKEALNSSLYGYTACNNDGSLVVAGTNENSLKLLTCDGNAFLTKAVLTDETWKTDFYYDTQDPTFYQMYGNASLTYTRMSMSSDGKTIVMTGDYFICQKDQYNYILVFHSDDLQTWELKKTIVNPYYNTEHTNTGFGSAALEIAKDASVLCISMMNYFNGTIMSGGIMTYN